MSEHGPALEAAAVLEHCKPLHLPTVAGQCASLVETEQKELEHLARARTTGHQGVVRARLVLPAASGVSTGVIARQL